MGIDAKFAETDSDTFYVFYMLNLFTFELIFMIRILDMDFGSDYNSINGNECHQMRLSHYNDVIMTYFLGEFTGDRRIPRTKGQ